MSRSDVLAVLALLVMAVTTLAIMLGGSVRIADFCMGFLSGIAIYSCYWRWKYGHWPD